MKFQIKFLQVACAGAADFGAVIEKVTATAAAVAAVLVGDVKLKCGRHIDWS